ncbi:AAA family ATPase [Lacipirellula parvula]|uniref:Primase C-terminal 1 domain-containing protein n=1 Tax=Lacipirellula parvula TaxID=2650471 RepID=A0A5K7X9E7_9BACT|nr:AAA family ATPase [Lacipirellula parvula]BBO32507.1 hypothetical protein PLANPX_2119 [Lacipirellula parvula]
MIAVKPSLADTIPAELQSRKQWVNWKLESRGGDKPTKVPYQPNGRKASTTNKATWSTYDAATQATGFDGIGFVFSPDDSYVGIDLDKCRNAATGVVEPWATEIVNSLATYVEVSPSGTGLHLIAKGELPCDGTGKKVDFAGGKVEAYSHGRYFCTTGNVTGLELKPVAERTTELNAFWAKTFGGSPSVTAEPASDAEACWARLEKMPDAVSGDRGHDRMLAVNCEILRHGISGEEAWALIHRFNEEKCDPPWSQTELEHKWKSANEKVLRGREFGVLSATASNGGPFSLGLIRWSDFQKDETPQQYLIPGLVAEAEHFVIGGRTKGLKTNTALDMMISLASGQPFFGHFPVAGPCPVAFISGESGRKSLQRRAATMASVRGAEISDDNFFIGFDLPKLSITAHLDAIQKAIEELGIKLLCVDPAYLATLTSGNADKASNQFAMGLILEPFGKIGTATGCTMALVHHARKASRAEQFQPMTREDLSQSGFDAWMRQWLLLSRRSAFRNGVHELHMEAGGSAGHFGQWAVTVDEGDDLRGRQWAVTVVEADQARANALQAAQDAKAERLALDISIVRSVLDTGRNEPLSKTAIREKTTFNSVRLAGVLAAMLANGELEDADYCVGGHKPKPGGYRLSTRLGVVA